MTSECVAESIPAGYKQTEVGVIPEDWDTISLGEIFVFKNGLNKSKAFFGYGTPIVNYMDVYLKRGFFSDDLKGRVSLNKQELRTFEVRKGDVFFTRTSETSEEVGMTSVILDEPQDTVFSGFILRARPKDSSLDNKFKKYCFSTSVVRKQITSQSTETTRALTNGRYLSAVFIARPPIAEQEAIAQALTDADALIESLEHLIDKKLQIKQGAMQELLTGKRRLPGFQIKHGYKNTEIGPVPEDWNVVSLLDVGQSLAGLTYSPSNVRNYGTLVLRSSNIQNGKLSFEDNVYVDMTLPERVIVEIDDILICVRNGSRQLIGKCALIDKSAAKSAFGAFMSIYRSKYSKFVFYQFQSEIIQRQISETMGATINQITNKDMASLIIPFPASDDEKNAIATVLSDMDAEIAAIEEKLEKSRRVKQGMMQELLTGRIRLV